MYPNYFSSPFVSRHLSFTLKTPLFASGSILNKWIHQKSLSVYMFPMIINYTFFWQQRMKQLDGITNSMDVSLSKLWESVMNWEACSAAVHELTKTQTQLSN